MTTGKFTAVARRSLLLVAVVVLGACGGGAGDPAGLSGAEVQELVRAELAAAPAPAPEPGLSAAEVAEIVRAELAAMPAPAPGEPAVSAAEVEAAIAAALEDMPQPPAALSATEVEEIVRAALAAAPALGAAEAERIARGVLASMPPRSDAAAYTQFVVDNAIHRYEADGLASTVAHYNRPESVDGQWYVFIVDESDTIISHYQPDRRGLDLNGWVGTDSNGYVFGGEMLAADEDGRWVSYVYTNPAGGTVGSAAFGELHLKNAWVKRHDGLLFGSGWYIDADAFTQQLVNVAVERYRTGGLQGTVDYFAGTDSALAGLESTIDYYNRAPDVTGAWIAFIARADGTIVAHSDPIQIGRTLEDLFGTPSLDAAAGGTWIIHPDTGEPLTLRVWIREHDNTLFGAGWHANPTD